MKNSESFDLTYITIDSLSEGIGSSQITPLISRLGKSGLRVNLISYEKFQPGIELIDFFKMQGISWNIQSFGANGLIGGLARLNDLRRKILNTNIIHARSDLPAASGIFSNEAPVLWDVRSLWADQKIIIQDNLFHRSLYPFYRGLESIAANKSLAMSTLTNAVVPILEQRHSRLPELRTVVPTTVDLKKFVLHRSFPPNVRGLFSGTYNDYYDLELSANFLKELNNLLPVDTHWAKAFESSKAKIGVGESKIITLTQSDMATLIPNYSFGIAICKLNAGPSLTAAMPTKIGEFLACGRPIVVNKGLGDMDRFIEEFDVGVILDGTTKNLQESASKLVSLLIDSETPQRCRELAEKYFNMDIAAKKYLEVYHQMTKL
jgi:hypothetical protein